MQRSRGKGPPGSVRTVSTPRYLDLPDGVRPTRLTTARGELAALVAGPSGPDTDAAPPALLVPGFTGSKEDFLPVLAPLADAGFAVTAIDLPGQWESPGDGNPSSYDVKSYAADVLALLSLLGPAHLLGHSFGGLVGRAAALADPTAMRSLTLLASGPAAIPHPTASNLGLLIQALPAIDLESIWVAKRQLEAPTEVAPPTPEIEDFLHRRFVANDPVSLLRMAEQLLAETDRCAELAATDVPVLVAFGSRDEGWPPAVQADMGRRLGATVAEFAEAAHSPAVEDPDATVAVLTQFWRATS